MPPSAKRQDERNRENDRAERLVHGAEQHFGERRRVRVRTRQHPREDERAEPEKKLHGDQESQKRRVIEKDVHHTLLPRDPEDQKYRVYRDHERDREVPFEVEAGVTHDRSDEKL